MPIILPQLKLVRLTFQFHRDNKQFDVTVWVNNPGILPALGSFELDLSATYTDYSSGDSPPPQINSVFPKTTPESTDVQPGGTNPFVYPNIPFIAEPGKATADYVFDVLLFAGPGGVVGDDNLHEEYKQFKPPLFQRPPIPIGARQ